jgi:peptidoglycan/xylan/chitin deacetylase (PgdA/CDA1 family)
LKTIYTCFPNGKFKALTMSYDDGNQTDRRIVGIFNRHGIKGAFHLNGGLLDRPGRIPREEIASLYAGHEVAAHTFTHPTISRCPLPMVAQEIIEDRKVLESLTGRPVRGLSYPNGSHSPEIRVMLPAMGIAYARVTGSSGDFQLPVDWHQWMATCHHNNRLMEHARVFAELSKWQYLSLMLVWGHGFEFDRDDNWDLIEEFCAFIGHRDDIWYATMIEITDYMEAAKRLQYAANGNFVFNPSALEVWIRTGEDIVALPPGELVMLQ